MLSSGAYFDDERAKVAVPFSTLYVLSSGAFLDAVRAAPRAAPLFLCVLPMYACVQDVGSGEPRCREKAFSTRSKTRSTILGPAPGRVAGASCSRVEPGSLSQQNQVPLLHAA